MRIKLFENFKKAPELLDSFQEAEGKLSDKDGIVLLGMNGDMTDIETAIEKIPHDEAFVLITDKSGHVPDSWKSDVFLVGAERSTEKSDQQTIKEYFGEWTDPAGGVHDADDDDPAAMYEGNELRIRLDEEDLIKLLTGGEVSGPGYKMILADIRWDRVLMSIKKAMNK